MKRALSVVLAVLMVLSCIATLVASAEETEAEIVDAAFALEVGKSLEGTKTLTGVVSQIVTEYNPQYENVTVNMTVKNTAGEDKTIQCYRMKGDDAATVEVGDTIRVTGTIKNFKGTVEFDQNCTFETVKKNSGDYEIKSFAGYVSGDVAIFVRQGEKITLEALGEKDYNAYGLILVDENGKVIDLDLRGPGRPDGVKGDVEVPENGYIIAINRDVAGYPIKVVEEKFVAEGIEKGSRIKLFGVDLEALKTAEMRAELTGASFSVLPRLPETEEEILAAAFALEPGDRLEGIYSLTGIVTEKIDNNQQVRFTVADKEILCYRMNQENFNAISVGDKITVTGILKNYQGTVEFDSGCTAEVLWAYLWMKATKEHAPSINIQLPSDKFEAGKPLTIKARVFFEEDIAGDGSAFLNCYPYNGGSLLSWVDYASTNTLSLGEWHNVVLEDYNPAKNGVEPDMLQFGAGFYLATGTMRVAYIKVYQGENEILALTFENGYDLTGANGMTRENRDTVWGLVGAEEPITEMIFDLGEVKNVNEIFFTPANAEGLANVKISLSLDGDDFYDMNNNGAITANGEGKFAPNMKTRGVFKAQYIKVTGEPNVDGTIEIVEGAAEKARDPKGPYSLTGLNASGYGSTLITSGTVDTNQGKDSGLNIAGSQLVIGQKVANGVYKMLVSSVNAWPSGGHADITSAIEGIAIEDGVITLGEGQVALVIMSSGAYATAGDEETSPAKHIARGLANNGFFRVEDEQYTFHSVEPEPVYEEGAPTIDGVLDEKVWADAEFKMIDGMNAGTWQNKVSGYTFEYAIAEIDGYAYFAVRADKADMTQLRVWFHTNPEAKLYTHFFDVYTNGNAGGLKTNQSLTTNSGSAYDATKLEAAFDANKQVFEAKVKLEDIGATTLGPDDVNVQLSDGNALHSRDFLPGNFTIDGTMVNSAYMPWVGWFEGEIPTYAGLVPKTNHWNLTPIGTDYLKYYYIDDALVVVDEASWPFMDYLYPEGDEQTYAIEGNQLRYNFSVANGDASIRLIFKTADGTVQYMMSNTALGLTSDQYYASNGDFKATSCSGVISLQELVDSKQLYQNTDFPAEAIINGEITFAGLQIYGINGATVTINELAVEPIPSLEPDSYLWMSIDEYDAATAPSVTFSVPADGYVPGPITIKALAYLSEDCEGTVYANCYPYHGGDLLNWVDYVDAKVDEKGKWFLVEKELNPAKNGMEPDSFSFGIGFWQGHGTIKIAYIILEQNGTELWSVDFKSGLDLSCAVNMTEENRDTVWGIVGEEGPFELELFVSHLNLYNWNTFDIMLITLENVTKLSNYPGGVDPASFVMYSVEKINRQYVVKEFVNDASMNEATPPEGGFLLFASVNNRSYEAIANGELVGKELVLNGFDLTANFAIDTQVDPNAAYTITAKDYVPNDDPGPEPTNEVQPEVLEELPAGAIGIDYAGYKHAGVVSIVAGDNQTIAELTARGNNGNAKDMNYAYNILVDKDNKVIDVDFTLAQACTFVCPEGGYIISYNGNKAGYEAMANIQIGDTITVYNVLIDKVRELEGNVELHQAGFTYDNGEEPEPLPVSHQKSYTYPENTRTDKWAENGSKLTDGVKNADGGSDGYSGWGNNNGVPTDVEIVVDLEAEYSVGKFNVHASENKSWGITIIDGFTVSYSLDGETFTEIEAASSIVETETAGAWTTNSYAIELEAPVKARFVKFSMIRHEGTQFTWIDEVEAWEMAEPEIPTVPAEDLFWLTHYEDSTVEGAGVIFTQDFGLAYWGAYAFEPIEGVENGYRLVTVAHSSGSATNVVCPENGFIYAINLGNDWPSLMQGKTGDGSSGAWYDDVAHLSMPNYVTANVQAMWAKVAEWQVGDEFIITGIDLENHTIPTSTPNREYWDPCYVCTATINPYEIESYQVTVNVSDNPIMTDGETGFDGAWGSVGTGKVVLVSNPECRERPMAVTILGELPEVLKLTAVRLDLYHDANVMIGYPEGTAQLYLSADGEEYTQVGDYELAESGLALGAHGTVINEFKFSEFEAKFVKIILNVGSNEAVLGAEPADGKIYWEFISIAEIMVEASQELDELPDNAIAIDYVGYKHAGAVSLVAGDNQTVAELTARGNNGTAKDMNYAYNILVDKDNKVIDVDFFLAQACTFVCPEGGYIISYNGNKAGFEAMADIQIGAVITLYNVDPEEARTIEGNRELEMAGFTYENPIPVTAPDEILVSHLNLYNWNTYDIMLATKNVKEIPNVSGGLAVENFVMYKVENINGQYVVKEFVTDASMNDAVPAAGGFLLFASVNNRSYAAIANGQLLDKELVLKDFDLSADFAIDTSANPDSAKIIEVKDYEPIQYKAGDIDGDGKVTAKDYQILKRYILGTLSTTPDEAQKQRMDFNGDGKWNATDYLMLKRYILGKYQLPA